LAQFLAAVERSGRDPDPPYVRRSLVTGIVLVGAMAMAPAAHAQSTGGAAYSAPTFKVSPTTVVAGAPLTLRYRVPGQPRRVRVRVDLLAAGGGAPLATLRLGKRRTNKRLKATWTPQLTPGSYTLRLRAPRVSAEKPLAVRAAVSGVFPVQGPYTFGGPDSRFGAVRDGHVHQGQDIAAAAGTPVVAPVSGTVYWRAYQADGAGHYAVVHGTDGRDYVFMHMQSGSVVVVKGQAVAAGDRIGAVGSSGHADGPHLHFEIWVGGWRRSAASAPVDPLAQLLAWGG
jgi:murein DD-endopeptidase MepM/ murein hydrolase activator NlpD